MGNWSDREKEPPWALIVQVSLSESMIGIPELKPRIDKEAAVAE